MKLIGLTGGIGSGKSTVARFLAELGAVVIDVDKIGHEILKADTEIKRKVITTFGPQILSSSGEIDRRKLGQIVFRDSEARLKLNQLMHPRMHNEVKRRLKRYDEQGVSMVVLEAPLLLEAGWASSVDEVWVTTAPEDSILRRLQERSGLSKSESIARLHSQLPVTERLKHADVVIDTDCSLDQLKAKVTKLWQGLHQ